MSQRFTNNPKPLVEIAAEVLDKQPLPACSNWDTVEVTEWLINTVKLPQYKACFERNFITGRKLILLGPGHLVRMNIRIFKHIEKIMFEIRRLFQVPCPTYAKDLTTPSVKGTQYDWNTLYYRYIARRSPDYVALRSVFWRKSKLIKEIIEPACHWLSIASGEDTDRKVFVARIRANPKRIRYYTPMFRENHYSPTTVPVYYKDKDPLTW